MGFIILIFQSIFNFGFIKATIAFAVVELLLVLFFEARIEAAVVKLVFFTIFSCLINKYQASIFKWLIVLISAGLIFG